MNTKFKWAVLKPKRNIIENTLNQTIRSLCIVTEIFQIFDLYTLTEMYHCAVSYVDVFYAVITNQNISKTYPAARKH